MDILLIPKNKKKLFVDLLTIFQQLYLSSNQYTKTIDESGMMYLIHSYVYPFFPMLMSSLSCIRPSPLHSFTLLLFFSPSIPNLKIFCMIWFSNAALSPPSTTTLAMRSIRWASPVWSIINTNLHQRMRKNLMKSPFDNKKGSICGVTSNDLVFACGALMERLFVHFVKHLPKYMIFFVLTK